MRDDLVLLDTLEDLSLRSHETRLQSLQVDRGVEWLHGLPVVRLRVELEDLDDQLRYVLQFECDLDRLIDSELFLVGFLEAKDDFILNSFEFTGRDVATKVNEAFVCQVNEDLLLNASEIMLFKVILVGLERPSVLCADQLQVPANQVSLRKSS